MCESIENLDVSILTRAPLEETDEMITSNEVCCNYDSVNIYETTCFGDNCVNL